MPSLSSNPWNSGERMEFEVSFAETELFVNIGKEPHWFQEGWKSRTESFSVWNNMQPLAKCFTPKSWKHPVLVGLKVSAGERRSNWITNVSPSTIVKVSGRAGSFTHCPLVSVKYSCLAVRLSSWLAQNLAECSESAFSHLVWLAWVPSAGCHCSE